MLLPQSDKLRPAERNYPIFHDSKMVTARSPNPLPNTSWRPHRSGQESALLRPSEGPQAP